MQGKTEQQTQTKDISKNKDILQKVKKVLKKK